MAQLLWNRARIMCPQTGHSLVEDNIEFSSPAALKPHILAFPPKPTLCEKAFGVCCNDLLDSRTLLTPTKRGGLHSKGSHSACLLSLQSQTLLSELILFKPVEVSTRSSQSRGRIADVPTRQGTIRPGIRWNLTWSSVAAPNHNLSTCSCLNDTTCCEMTTKADNCNDLLCRSGSTESSPSDFQRRWAWKRTMVLIL